MFLQTPRSAGSCTLKSATLHSTPTKESTNPWPMLCVCTSHCLTGGHGSAINALLSAMPSNMSGSQWSDPLMQLLPVGRSPAAGCLKGATQDANPNAIT